MSSQVRICHFVLVTITCAFSCKLKRECQDRLGKKLRDLVCLSYEQVIRRDDAIVRPHLQSKIQESLEDRGKLLVDPPSKTTIVVGQNASVVSCWLLSSRRLVICLSFDCSGEIILPSIF